MTNSFHKIYTEYTAVRRAALPLFVIVIGIIFAIFMVFNKQILEQHANVVTLKSFAVNGSIYLDTNTNGKKDSGETNYKGDQKPLVRLALFTEVCRPTPTPNVSTTPTPGVSSTPTPTTATTPTPTLAPGCHYMCPMVACIRLADGTTKCPSCTPTCITPGSGGKGGIPEGKGEGVGKQGEDHQEAAQPVTVGSVTSGIVSKDDVKDMDLCRETPEKVVPCTVNDDGTYTCVVNDVTFSRASLILNPPSGYVVTSHNNPFNMNGGDYANNPTATVDFGIALQSTITPPPGCYYKACTIACPVNNPNCCPKVLVCNTPTPKVSGNPTPTVKPVCIPQPDCLQSGKCSYPTPPGGWCPLTGKPLTNDEVSRLLAYLNQLLRDQLRK